MRDLLETDAAHLVETPAELGTAVDRHQSGRIDTDRFFRLSALDNVREALDAVRRRESIESSSR